jgi:hypothetical protein
MYPLLPVYRTDIQEVFPSIQPGIEKAAVQFARKCGFTAADIICRFRYLNQIVLSKLSLLLHTADHHTADKVSLQEGIQTYNRKCGKDCRSGADRNRGHLAGSVLHHTCTALLLGDR